MNGRILPEKYRFISGSAMNVLAVTCMLIDHIAYSLLASNPIPLFTVFGKQITLYYLMRFIGRLAFPIYAFLIVEGARYTRSRIRYGVSLLAFALLSEIPWDLNHFGVLWRASSQNVFFTLFLGFVCIWFYEDLREKRVLQIVAILTVLIASLLLHADYGITGVCFILLLYALREHELLRDAVGVGVLSSTWMAGLAFIPLAFYNGKRGFIKGPVFKYAFYLFYPVHLLILYFIKQRLGI